jgi:hypothetical protein
MIDLVVHQQQHLHCSGNIPVGLTKFERNFTKRTFCFVTQIMSKRNFCFETEGV